MNLWGLVRINESSRAAVVQCEVENIGRSRAAYVQTGLSHHGREVMEARA